MSGERPTERVLPAILTDLGAGPTSDYSDLLARTARSRQRPGWTFPERWLPMDITLRPVPAFAGPRRTLVLLVLLIVAVIAAAALYVGAQPHLPAPFGLARNGAIVFADKAGNIYVQDSIESPRRKVMDGATGGWPSFSPDGTKLVSLQQAGNDRWDLVVADADGAHRHAITDPSLAELPWWGAGRRTARTSRS
jgi:hypothetical protein